MTDGESRTNKRTSELTSRAGGGLGAGQGSSGTPNFTSRKNPIQSSAKARGRGSVRARGAGGAGGAQRGACGRGHGSHHANAAADDPIAVTAAELRASTSTSEGWHSRAWAGMPAFERGVERTEVCIRDTPSYGTRCSRRTSKRSLSERGDTRQLNVLRFFEFWAFQLRLKV